MEGDTSVITEVLDRAIAEDPSHVITIRTVEVSVDDIESQLNQIDASDSQSQTSEIKNDATNMTMVISNMSLDQLAADSETEICGEVEFQSIMQSQGEVIPAQRQDTIQVGDVFVRVVDGDEKEETEPPDQKSPVPNADISLVSLRPPKKNVESVDNAPKTTGLWFSTEEELNQYIKEFQERSQTHYVSAQVDRYFGKEAVDRFDLKDIKQIQWKGSKMGKDSVLNGLIPFDGSPYVQLCRKRLMCHQGKDYYGGQKSEKIKFDTRLEPLRKKKKHSKKSGCPALILIKQIVKFPGIKIQHHTDFYKAQAQRKLRGMISRGDHVETSVHYVMSIPKLEDHLYHQLGKVTMPLHPTLKQAIFQFMTVSDIRSAADMMKAICAFRLTFFMNREMPRESDSRWFPTQKCISNAMHSIKVSLEKGTMDPVTGERIKKEQRHDMKPLGDMSAEDQSSRLQYQTIDSTLDLGEVLEIASHDVVDVVFEEGTQSHMSTQRLSEAEIAARNLVSIQSGGSPNLAATLQAVGGEEMKTIMGGHHRLVTLHPPHARLPNAKRALDPTALSAKCRGLLDRMQTLSEACNDTDTLNRLHTSCLRSIRELRSSIPKEILKVIEPPPAKRRKSLLKPESRAYAEVQDNDVRHLYYPAAFGGL